MGMKLKSLTANFLDRKTVTRKVDRKKIRVLMKQGAFVRRTARSSMPGPTKKRKPPSSPGEPPRAQVGTLKKFIFFKYDSGTESVVVGPARVRADDQDAPRTLEFGGMVRTGGGLARIAARPYMGPALDENAPRFAEMWRKSIR
jgi:hypothetical protein